MKPLKSLKPLPIPLCQVLSPATSNSTSLDTADSRQSLFRHEEAQDGGDDQRLGRRVHENEQDFYYQDLDPPTCMFQMPPP